MAQSWAEGATSICFRRSSEMAGLPYWQRLFGVFCSTIKPSTAENTALVDSKLLADTASAAVPALEDNGT